MCVPGQFQATGNSTDCVECNPGWYQINNASTECFECPTGSSCAEKEELPFKCLDGFYQLEPGKIFCHMCTFEDFQLSDETNTSNTSTATADVCKSCYAGTFCVNVSAPPLPCEAGYYTPYAAMTSCLECSSGMYAGQAGTSQCIGCPVGNACSSTEVFPCETGYYQDDIERTFCKMCEAGFFQNETEGTICYNCQPGFFCELLFRNTTQACSTGMYQDNSAQTSCKECESGYFQIDDISSKETLFKTAANRTSCNACQAGYKCATTDENEQVCALGWYNNADRQTKCYECQTGYYANVTGSLGCLPCPPGSRCPFKTQAPELCLPGWFQSASSETNCIECSAGKIQLEYGGIECFDCAIGSGCTQATNSSAEQVCGPGKFQDSAGKSDCEDCETGRYQTQSNATECFLAEPGTTTNNKPGNQPEDCPQGMFQANNGSTFCDICAPGYTAAVQKSTICDECQPGYYCPSTSVPAEPCPIGQYEEESRSTRCKTCPVGQFTNLEGQATCIHCPENSIAAASRSECVCTTSYYRVSLDAVLFANSYTEQDYDDSDPFFCMECPEGSICNRSGNMYSDDVVTFNKTTGAVDKTEDGTTYYPYSQTGVENIDYPEVPLLSALGYWQNESWFNESTSSMVDFENCWTTDCAEGGWSQCNHNKSGPMCARCGDEIEDLTRVLPQWKMLGDGECYPCVPQEFYWVYGTMGVAALIAIVIALLMLRCKERWLPRLRTWWYMRGSHKKVKENNKKSSGVLMKVKLLLSYFQIVSMFSGDAALASTNEIDGDTFTMETFSKHFEFINMEWTHHVDLGCLLRFSYPVRFFTNTAMVLGTVCLIWIVYRASIQRNRFRPFLNKQRATQLLMIFLFTVYPNISQLSMSPLQCKEFKDGVIRLAANGYQTVCWEGVHVILAVGSVVYTLLFPLGIPTLIFILLYRNRKKLDETNEEFKPSVLKAYTFLVKDYRADRWYFECLAMGQKLVLTIIITFLPSGSPQQQIVALIALLIFFGIFSVMSPYNQLQDTFLFALSQLAVICLLLEGLLLKMDTSPQNEWILVVIRTLPFAAMVFTVCFALVLIIIDFKNMASKSATDLKEKLRELTESIFGKKNAASDNPFLNLKAKDEITNVKRLVRKTSSRKKLLTRSGTKKAGILISDGENSEVGNSLNADDISLPTTVTIKRGRGTKTFTQSESQLILDAVNQAFDSDDDDDDDDDNDNDDDSGAFDEERHHTPGFMAWQPNIKTKTNTKRSKVLPFQVAQELGTKKGDRKIANAWRKKIGDRKIVNAWRKKMKSDRVIHESKVAHKDAEYTETEMVQLLESSGTRRVLDPSLISKNSKHSPPQYDKSQDVSQSIIQLTRIHGQKDNRVHNRNHYDKKTGKTENVHRVAYSSIASVNTTRPANLDEAGTRRSSSAKGHKGKAREIYQQSKSVPDLIGSGDAADLASVLSPLEHHHKRNATMKPDVITGLHSLAGLHMSPQSPQNIGKRHPSVQIDGSSGMVTLQHDPRSMKVGPVSITSIAQRKKREIGSSKDEQQHSTIGNYTDAKEATTILDELSLDMDDFKKHDFVEI
jgi:hypothetical protein